MSLRVKTMLLLTAVVVVLVAALAAVYARSSLTRLRAIEQEQISADLDRTVLQIESSLENLAGINADWAYWDDSYEYIRDGAPTFAQDNLYPGVFLPISVDVAIFTTTAGEIRFGSWYDADGNEGPLPDALVAGVQPGGRFSDIPPERGALTGVAVIDGRILLVAVRESLRFADESAPPVGSLLFARELTSEVIAEVVALTGIDLTITPCTESVCGEANLRLTTAANSIAAATTLAGVDGQPMVRLEVTDDRRLYRDGAADVRRVLLITLAVGGAAVALALLVVHRTLVSRLVRLRDATGEVGRTGDLAIRVPAEGHDEIAALATGMNGMLAGLETARAELAEAKRDVERASEAKSKFLARVSHEVRNPLNGVTAYAQLLAMDPLTPEQRESVQQILVAGRHITSLLEEFLDMARIEAGRIPLDLRSVSARTIASEAINLSRPLAAERNITLKGAGDDAVVVADEVRLRQVVLNLLSNAIKYNRVGGTVGLQLSRGPEVVVIAVWDDGPGIPPDKLDRLFVPFDRLDADRGPTAGTGVGLAIVKQLVELMGGSISVESEVGRGTRFSVLLPASAVADPVAPAGPPRTAASAGSVA